jgi:tRNA threonylcarbamoyladenosine biosynthesis protein TsaB
MLILTVRTDKPESEIGLFEDNQKLGYEVWPAHRQLAETIHTKVASLLKSNSKDWSDIQALVAYQGPGSFTGLRIGLSFANAVANSNSATIVGTTGEDWLEQGIKMLLAGSVSTVVLPEYGAPVHITAPKK